MLELKFFRMIWYHVSVQILKNNFNELSVAFTILNFQSPEVFYFKILGFFQRKHPSCICCCHKSLHFSPRVKTGFSQFRVKNSFRNFELCKALSWGMHARQPNHAQHAEYEKSPTRNLWHIKGHFLRSLIRPMCSSRYEASYPSLYILTFNVKRDDLHILTNKINFLAYVVSKYTAVWLPKHRF